MGGIYKDTPNLKIEFSETRLIQSVCPIKSLRKYSGLCMRFFISWQMNHCWVRTYKLVVYACTVYLEDTDLLTLIHWKLKREILIRGSCNINTLSISSLCISFPLFIIKCECSKTGLKLFTAKVFTWKMTKYFK